MVKNIKGILFLSIIGLSMSACTSAPFNQDLNVDDPIDAVFSESREMMESYNAHQLFIKQEEFIKIMGLDPRSVRGVDIYSLRSGEDFMTYTVEVTMEVPMQNNDVKCIKRKYDVVMDRYEERRVKSIAPTSSFVIDAIIQVPYHNEISEMNQNRIKDILKVLLTKDKIFFRNYESSWLEGYDEWINFLSKAPALYSKIKTSRSSYKEDYSLGISPYTIGDEQISLDMDQISFEVGEQTTKKVHFVHVNIPVEVLRDYNNKIYYNYEYLVVLDEGIVTSIKLIKKEML